MAENDSVDVLTAFAIGAMIGVGATLLLRSDPPSTRERIIKRVTPLARKAKRAGRDVVDDLQREIEDVLASAREDLTDAARRQLKAARRRFS